MMESNEDLALCYGSIQEVYKDGTFFRNVITKLHSGFIFDKLLLQFDISIITSMLRKSILLDSSLNFDNNIRASEEFCLFMQLASKYKIGVSREIMAKYRVHQTSLTSQSLSILGKERRYTLDLIIKSTPILNYKYKKQFKGKNFNKIFKNIKPFFFSNSLGLKIIESGLLNSKHFETIRQSVKKILKKTGRITFFCFPQTPKTKKPLEIRMGKGKGNVAY